MAKEIILSKESSESEIKAYFNAVLKLSQSDNEFPINFDEVWMLVYQDKHKAVNELKDKFIEDVDYQAVTQKVECQNGIGSSRRIDYYLTVSCMEFFIARKVRPVFEVYRKVFHGTIKKAIETNNQPSIKDKIAVAKFLSSYLNLNESSKLIIAKSIAEPLGLPTPDYTPSKGIVKSATELLKEKGLSISAQAFNQRAIQKGFLCEMKRKSSHGKDKPFKSITESGLLYGENQVNPNNPKSTQPLWYEDKFIELLGLLGFQLAKLS